MASFSDIQVRPFSKPGSNFLGSGTVTLGDLVKVNFRVLKGKNGAFVSWPATKSSKPDANGKDRWFNEVTFIDDDFRNEVSGAILKAHSQSTSTPRNSPSSHRSSSEEAPF